MKWTLPSARRLRALGLAAVLTTLPVEGRSADDLDAIRDTVFTYFDGVRLADRARLERAFATDIAHMMSALPTPDGSRALSSRPIAEVIDDWAARAPRPAMRGRILAIDIYSEIAAQVLFDFDGRYLDAFQLAKIDGTWRIVNKFFVEQAGAP